MVQSSPRSIAATPAAQLWQKEALKAKMPEPFFMQVQVKIK